ncbi:Rrf2 family transcriptional regulator [Rhizobium sp. P40RR-XXII]|uniref:RrF2 family transcriptional regulator n=1 Tax=unclassified Rhizobium TaxID=2613769 RepID=UPI001456778B|nr:MULTISPECIES: Rrf2 family transcriptional regulator [unclassified Rhizobium]NLR88840.1 Rrf2 family transcriptional regulator [Rhizobium sp. P28RR-XV]NLS20511.1 Rrf2 family transcriptional regulator [Rhizobium sp. P40RR-XXII]
MRLTVYSDYALRLMMYLGLRPGGNPSTIDEVAAAYGISKAHLMKITNELGRKGLIETIRGRQGGMRLAHDASAIRVGDIVRACEPDFALVPCMEAEGGNACVVLPACVLKRALATATAAFLEVLDGYTLQDLVGPTVALRQLLGLEKSERVALR